MSFIRPILVLLLVLPACTTVKPAEPVLRLPAYETTTGFDFRPFSERGFLMTPYNYEGRYEPRGLITVTLVPEALRNRADRLDQGGATTTLTDWNVTEVSASQGLQRAYEQASGFGADALVNVVVEAIPVTRSTGDLTTFTVIGVKVTGFAIKRL